MKIILVGGAHDGKELELLELTDYIDIAVPIKPKSIYSSRLNYKSVRYYRGETKFSVIEYRLKE